MRVCSGLETATGCSLWWLTTSFRVQTTSRQTSGVAPLQSSCRCQLILAILACMIGSMPIAVYVQEQAHVQLTKRKSEVVVSEDWQRLPNVIPSTHQLDLAESQTSQLCVGQPPYNVVGCLDFAYPLSIHMHAWCAEARLFPLV